MTASPVSATLEAVRVNRFAVVLLDESSTFALLPSVPPEDECRAVKPLESQAFAVRPCGFAFVIACSSSMPTLV